MKKNCSLLHFLVAECLMCLHKRGTLLIKGDIAEQSFFQQKTCKYQKFFVPLQQNYKL